MLNKDKYGFISQIQPDGSFEGGDSVCWTGHYIYLTDDTDGFYFTKVFEVGFGGYVRHPHEEMTNNAFGAYYMSPWQGCISRDQLTGILLALIAKKDYFGMVRVMIHHSLRLFLFAYNTLPNGTSPSLAEYRWKMPDITFMDIWALELRGFGLVSWLFWPLLVVLDLHLLANAIYDKYFDNEEEDVINFVGKLIASNEHVPTPTSWLATKFVNKDNLIKRLTKYWCGWRANCDFVALFKNKLDDIL